MLRSSTLAQAWEHYAARMSAARSVIESSQFFGDETAADAYLYLAGLFHLHHDTHLRAGDTDYPTFLRTGSTPGRDSKYSNADTFYLAAHIDGSKSYRLTGRLGTVNQTIIGTYLPESAAAHSRLTEADVRTDDDGAFEIAVGPSRPPDAANWLPTTDDVTTVVVYEVYGDWDTETRGVFTIHSEASLGLRRPPADANDVARRLRAAADSAHADAVQWSQISDYVTATSVTNAFNDPVEYQVAMLGAKFVSGQWHLGDDEALLIEVEPPADARYWGWATYSMYGTHLDFVSRQTSLNHTQADVDPDGVLRIVASPRDPGIHNWLDIEGHHRGRLTWRVSTAGTPPTPRAQVIPADGVHAALPHAARTVSSEERRAQIARRHRAVARRFAE